VKKGTHTQKKAKVWHKVTFRLPKTKTLARKPKVVARAAVKQSTWDKYAIVKHPLTSESVIKTIEDHNTLQGPAEPIQINYQASNATVVNNGHTIQVNVAGNNSITVRGSTYQLLQFHFHHPSEEQINSRRFTMVAHLVHKNAEGQLAVIGVLLSPGAANALIHKVWTYMPLDSGDQVNMPLGMLDLNELVPKDQRYYQFMGSLTTPPCSENVLWMVLKQPMTLSPEQIKMFAQIFPNNARPVQPLHARLVRNAQ
jgi:carbonic anhydrase